MCTQIQTIVLLTLKSTVLDWSPTSPTVFKTWMKATHASLMASLQLAVTVSQVENLLYSAAVTSLFSVQTQYPLQLEFSAMHPALMVHCDSVMATSQEREGWRSASTMPGAQSVTMDGTIQMLQWSADS